MKVTMRKVVIVGGIVSSLAVFLGAFAMNIYYIIAIFGGLTGDYVHFELNVTGYLLYHHLIK